MHNNCDLIQFSLNSSQKSFLGVPITEVKHFTELPTGFLTYLNYNRMLRYDKFKLFPVYSAIFAGAFSFPSENFKKNPFFISGFSFFNPAGDCGWVYFDKQEAGFNNVLFLKNFIKVRKFALGGYYRDSPTTITHNFVYSKKFNYFLLSNNYVQPNNFDWKYRNVHRNYFFDSVSRSRDVFRARKRASALDAEILFPVDSYNLISKGISLVKFSEEGVDLDWATRHFDPALRSGDHKAPAAFSDYLNVSLADVSKFYKATAFNTSLDRFDANTSSVLKFTRRGFKSKIYSSTNYKNALKGAFESLKFFNPLLNSNFVSSFESLDQCKNILKKPRELKVTRRRKFFLLRNKGFKRLKSQYGANFYMQLKNENGFIAKAALESSYVALNRVRKIDRLLNKIASSKTASTAGNQRTVSRPFLNKSPNKKKRLRIRKPSQFKLKSRRPKKGRSLLSFFKTKLKDVSIFNATSSKLATTWDYFYRMARRHKARFSRGRKFYKGFWSVSDRRVTSTRRRKP